MYEFRDGLKSAHGDMSPEPVGWLMPPAAQAPRQRLRMGVARLQAQERAVVAMERRLAALSARHERTLPGISGRLDRLRESVGKVSGDTFVNGGRLGRLLSRLARRIRTLEKDSAASRRGLSVPGRPPRAA